MQARLAVKLSVQQVLLLHGCSVLSYQIKLSAMLILNFNVDTATAYISNNQLSDLIVLELK